MPVYQSSGPGLGESLANAVQTALLARRQKRFDDQNEQDRARSIQNSDIQDLQAGVHRLAPGELPPASVAQNIVGGVNADAITGPGYADALKSAMSTPPSIANANGGGLATFQSAAKNIPGHPANRAPTPAAASPLAATDPGASFQSTLASTFAGSAPAAEPRYEFGKNFYIDRQPQIDAAATARAQHMQDQFMPTMIAEFTKQQDRDRKIQQYTNAGIPAARAALYVDNPSLADNDPTVGKPHTDVMAERTPKSVMVNGKAAEVMIDKAGKAYDSSGKPVVGQITPYIAPPNPDTQALRELALGTRKDAMSQRNEARLVSQYTEATKKYSQTADALQAINENRAGALKGDPIAQQTLLQDFIKLNLPGQQVTEGDIGHYMHLMGLGEKGQQLLDKLRQGTPLGEQQIKLILSHADNLAVERRKAHQYLRQQYVDRGERSGVPAESFPDWFGFLPPSGSEPPAKTAPNSGDINLGDTAGRTITVNGKTFKVPE